MANTIHQGLQGTPIWRLGDRRIASVVPMYQQIHFQHLTAFHRVVVAYCPVMHLAQSSARERHIIIPEIVDDPSYCCALHELGHIIEPTQQPVNVWDSWIGSPNVRHNEIEAWRWAQAHALWWTPEMDAVMQYALWTYGIPASAVLSA